MRTGTWRRAAAVWAGSAAVSAGISACGSTATPPSEGGAVVSAKARSEQEPPQHDAYAKLGYRLTWRAFPDVSEGHHITGVDPMGDTVIVRESATRVSAIDAKSGSMRWSDQLAGPLTNLVGAVRRDNAIGIVSDTDVFVMDAGTGNLLNRYALGKVTSVPPLLTDFSLVIAASDGQVVAYQRQTGFHLWANSVDTTIEVAPVPVLGTCGAFVSRNGELLVVDLGTGAGQGRARMRGGPTAPPAVSEDTVFVTSSDQSVYAFEARTGDQLWRFRTPTALLGAPTYYDRAVYVDIPGSGLTALESSSGRPAWTSDSVKGRVIGVVKGRLLVWDAAGGDMAIVDRKDGSVFERAHLDGVRVLSTDGLVDPVLYVATAGGVLERLSPR
jgi:outer membrane protein assembly factor BamB